MGKISDWTLMKISFQLSQCFNMQVRSMQINWSLTASGWVTSVTVCHPHEWAVCGFFFWNQSFPPVFITSQNLVTYLCVSLARELVIPTISSKRFHDIPLLFHVIHKCSAQSYMFLIYDWILSVTISAFLIRVILGVQPCFGVSFCVSAAALMYIILPPSPESNGKMWWCAFFSPSFPSLYLQIRFAGLDHVVGHLTLAAH